MIDILYKAYIFLFLLLVSCSGEAPRQFTEPVPTTEAVTDLIIGAVDQPLEHQLGEPVAIRTDSLGSIYIADRSSKEIKVFDVDGNYVRSLAGRGRGPGELLEIELMELTPEGHLVIMDRGNLEYKVISTEGEQIDSFQYNLSDQFYPASISYMGDHILGLFLRVSTPAVSPFERNLFHIYTADFQERRSSFLPVNQLGFDEMFYWHTLGAHQGSFLLSEDETLFYSPGTYTGNVYVLSQTENGDWTYREKLNGKTPNIEPWQLLKSQEQLNTAIEEKVARAIGITWGDNKYYGRQLAMDAGLYHLNDGRLIQFYAVWNGGKRNEGSETHPMDLYAQVFDSEGNLLKNSFLFTYAEPFTIAFRQAVNWKDNQDRFYLFESPNDVPTIRRFTLDLQD